MVLARMTHLPCRGSAPTLADLTATTLIYSPAEFGKFEADEVAKWTKVIKFAGIKAG